MNEIDKYPSFLPEYIPRVIIPNKFHGNYDGLSCMLNDFTCYFIYKIKNIIRKICGQRAAWESYKIKEISSSLINHLENRKYNGRSKDKSGWMISKVLPGEMLIVLVSIQHPANYTCKINKGTANAINESPHVFDIPIRIEIKNVIRKYDDNENTYNGIYDCEWDFL